MDEDAVRTAADAFWAALRTGDGAAIASLMSPHAQGEVLRVVRRWLPTVSTTEAAAARYWSGSLIKRLRFVTVSVELEGTRAIARWDLPDLHGTPEDSDYLALVWLDGRWLVDWFGDVDDTDDAPPSWLYET